MDDRSALVAAINANLDDDLPRLAYSDWLEEHDQLPRAQFIRAYCEIVSTGDRAYAGADPIPGTKMFRGVKRLSDLAHELLKENAYPWTWEILQERLDSNIRDSRRASGIAVVNSSWFSVGYVRGMVEQASIDALGWFENHERFTALEPVRFVNLTTWPTRDMMGIGDVGRWLRPGGESLIAHIENELKARWPKIRITLPGTSRRTRSNQRWP